MIDPLICGGSLEERREENRRILVYCIRRKNHFPSREVRTCVCTLKMIIFI
jgi:hypothetical protein